MRNAYLVENRPFTLESQPLVEAHGVGLGVKVYLGEPEFCGLVHEMCNHGLADALAPVVRQDRDPADLA